ENEQSRPNSILGPTLHAEVGDTLRIHFNNMANKPLTIHPQGIKYGKTSEGSDYADSTFNLEKMDDAVLPGQTYTYNWDIPESVGPKDADPFCLTYIYYSHENMVQDFNSGLVGTLLICKNGSLNDNGLQKFFKKEFILMFAVFDESQSSLTASPKDDGMLMYTVNGYVNGTMPVFEACVGDTISWHIIGMSSKPELFSVHFFGQSLEQNRHRMSVIGLVGSSSTTANMTVNQIGKWLISSLNHKHLQAGMHCYIDVKLCGDKSASIRRLSLFQKRYIKVWEHFIAAEEVMWDYNHGSKDKQNKCRTYQVPYMANFQTSIIPKYKKVIYKEYTDKTFTKRVPPASDSLLGPIIRAQVKDTITVVFKNMASKPYSIYPHGVSIHKDHEGATYPPNLKGAETQDQAVMPGDIRTYQWTVLDTDEPTRNDSQCLSRMYHSAVNIHRDIASGLIGPLLICKSMSLNTRGYQEKADEEQVAMFTVFDENQSWYREENLKGLQKDSRTQPSEYNANVIQTINGNSILNTILGFCHSHIVQWHVASVGFVDEILSVHITGHLFRYRKRREDVINLFPMSSESVTVEMDNQGVGKIPGQRTGFYRYYAIKNDSSETQNLIEVNENFQANISIRSGSGKPGLSPRGLKPEIIIGVPRDNDEGYNEYDYDSMNEDDNTPNFQYIKFEDPYKVTTDDDMNSFSNPDMIIERYLRSAKGKMRNYFIAAEEIQWDYTGMQKSQLRGTQFTKVIYRQYTDGTFQRPELQGEYEEHLGILGPVIRAEVEDVIQVTFKNFASRAYSIHAHGVSYEKSSEGWSYEDESHEWLKKDDLVKPGESHVYVWYAKKQSGPEPEGFDCRAWVYYSAVNPERDIHSGLIGPLLICRNGTLDKNNRPLGVREFTLLFMTFEEEKSWYSEKIVRKPCTEMTAKPSSSMKCYNFHAINGIMYNLQGLQMYEGEKVRWHLLNMGGPKDTHVVHFHGQTFIENTNKESQHGIYPLLPGSFATIEMVPSKVGRWLLDTEVAEYQQAGMQAIFQITDAECNLPLGMEAGSISDHQITAAHHIDYWEPRLARLNYAGSYNAWSAEMNKTSLPWIQVDLEKQLLITGIKTQGASKYFTSFYTKEFFIVYSKDRKKWSTFKGNTIGLQKLFQGNTDSSTITENEIEPPISARYIRVYPTKYSNKPTIRMELLGCEIQGCFKPLGMENNLITDEQITASSYKTSWYRTWKPSLARLNKQGMVNAWQAKSNNNQQWLQIDFLQTKKLTGIATQGVKSFTTEMYVTGYTVFYSENGNDWNAYTDPSTKMEKIFKGNSNNYGHVRNQFKTPIFSRFLKIIPKTWSENIAMRIEIYGCDL
uniref:Coagulation factor V n=1 Tax=Leptobrachium leishanense TaxID=445787 RepID=A0A8C5LQL5_9ANUR